MPLVYRGGYEDFEARKHDYLIVYFTDENAVDVAPSNWLVNFQVCMWPTSKKPSPATLARRRAAVDTTFIAHKVQIIRGYGNYDKFIHFKM